MEICKRLSLLRGLLRSFSSRGTAPGVLRRGPELPWPTSAIQLPGLLLRLPIRPTARMGHQRATSILAEVRESKVTREYAWPNRLAAACQRRNGTLVMSLAIAALSHRPGADPEHAAEQRHTIQCSSRSRSSRAAASTTIIPLWAMHGRGGLWRPSWLSIAGAGRSASVGSGSQLLAADAGPNRENRARKPWASRYRDAC